MQPNEVIFLSQQAYRDIYGFKANTRRSKSYEAWKTSADPNTALTIDPASHNRKRKILNQAFTEKSVKNAASFVTQHTDRWIDLIVADEDIVNDGGWSKSRDMSDWTNWLIFDILGDICFGRSFEIKEPGPNPIRAIPELVQNHVLFFYPVCMVLFFKTKSVMLTTSRFYSLRSWSFSCGPSPKALTVY